MLCVFVKYHTDEMSSGLVHLSNRLRSTLAYNKQSEKYFGTSHPQLTGSVVPGILFGNERYFSIFFHILE